MRTRVESAQLQEFNSYFFWTQDPPFLLHSAVFALSVNVQDGWKRQVEGGQSRIKGETDAPGMSANEPT